MVEKLIVVIMGPGKKHFAEMCLDSVKNADGILYWTNNPRNISIPEKPNLFGVIDNEWDETDPQTNGKCRQRYLEHLKENYPNDWCLVVDEDEIVEEGGIKIIKQFIQRAQKDIYSVKMRHFIGDLGHEDSTKETHFVPNRLFKINKTDKYPLHSHPVLEGIKNSTVGNIDLTTIWHLGHLPVEYMDYILKRYKQHSNDSIIHTKQELADWKNSHLFGCYSTKILNPLDLPKQICDRYDIDKDEFYFKNNGVEAKHSIMVKQWYDFFNPKSVLDLGCGTGAYLHIWSWFVDKCKGIEISKYAVDNAICKKKYIENIDLLKTNLKKKYDLVVAFDVLEHLKYENLNKAISIIKKHAKKDILISIPYKDDMNINLDPTHIIKEDKKWWIKQFKKHNLKIINTPNDFLYNNQIVILKNEK